MSSLVQCAVSYGDRTDIEYLLTVVPETFEDLEKILLDRQKMMKWNPKLFSGDIKKLK